MRTARLVSSVVALALGFSICHIAAVFSEEETGEVVSIAASPSSEMPERKLSGRPVKVASVWVKNQGGKEQNLKEALRLLETAGEAKGDIACLPEDFLRTGGTGAEPVPGPTTKAVSELAREYKMCVICPLYELVGEKRYNSAVLIGREGEIVGTYRKVYPYWSEHGVAPGNEVKVFETDFGRIAILICFDINFPLVWEKADELGADIVFWPSAYSGGMPFKAYAIVHNYTIVTSTQNGHAMFVDITGDVIRETRGSPMTLVTLDVDRALFHENFNGPKMEKLFREHGGEVKMRHFADEEWYLLEAVSPGLRVRELTKEYGLETLREYRWRSRREIDAIRERGEALE